jgi:hypothetical protein
MEGGCVIEVKKQQVEQYVIGDSLVLGKAEALALYDSLTAALDKPTFTYLGCSNRYSHPRHSWDGARGVTYVCPGRSQDAT